MNDNFFKSKTFLRILYGIGIAAAVLLVFNAGMIVGFRKASFSYNFGENYYRAFGHGEMKIPNGIPGFLFDDLSGAHGAAGKIIKVSLPTFIIEDKNNVEKVIRLNDDSTIKLFRNNVGSTSISVGNFAVVIGSPNDKSEIDASFVRILPPPPDISTSSPSQNNIKK
ncbi:MAG: hypothetical protein WCT19_01390 [Candidatus Paceibacterota bacterium]|jgi:hypothetical protein